MKTRFVFIPFILLIFSACQRHEPAIPETEANKPKWTAVEKENADKANASQIHSPVNKKARTAVQQTADEPQQDKAVRQNQVGKLVSGAARGLPRPREAVAMQSQDVRFEAVKPATESATSLNSFIMLHFDNDIFAERDLYYTNGIGLTFIHPVMGHLPLTRYLPGLGRQSVNLYGLHLKQKMYTPDIPEAVEVDVSDRPFAGVLTLHFFRQSHLQSSKLRLFSEFQLGSLGPMSMAERVQRHIHDKEPSGWIFQIPNNLIANLNLSLEKDLFTTPFSVFGLRAGLKAGSLHTRISSGVYFSLGHDMQQETKTGIHATTITPLPKKSWQYWLFGSLDGRWVYYDATLHGGLFNRNSPHQFSRDQTEPLVWQAELGFVLRYLQYGLQFSYTYVSPEFKGGKDHYWGGIKLIYNY